MSGSPTWDRGERTAGSMQWAAWADALGFISEIVTAPVLARRTGGRDLEEPISWTRLVGGRSGVQATLPAGTYSDDTQLRLATARAISSRGFDAEAFAAVELPVWMNYALGGGRATKAAARAMSRETVAWFANDFKGWTLAGGNGVAMRIQPHVYAATNLSSDEFIEDIVRNGVVTHGHPRALVGAVLHGVALAYTIEVGRVPGPDEWEVLLARTADAYSVFEHQPELKSYWKPSWEATTGREFRSAWFHTIVECRVLLSQCRELYFALQAHGRSAGLSYRAYGDLVSRLELTNPDSRGSGTTTSVAALVLGGAIQGDPRVASVIAARAIGTDTDTIATMAAALAGAATPVALPEPLPEWEYIDAESRRLAGIAAGVTSEPFPYPDLLHWKPPKTAVDSVGLVDGELTLAGLSPLESLGSPYDAGEARWQWFRTVYGQRVLAKQRLVPRELAGSLAPSSRVRNWLSYHDDQPHNPASRAVDVQATLFDDGRQVTFENAGQKLESAPVSIEPMLDWVVRQGLTDSAVGYAIRRIVEAGTEKQLLDFVRRLRVLTQHQLGGVLRE